MLPKYKQIIELIQKSDKIFLFHHQYPDLDTLGSQFSFYEWLKFNFKNKDIFLIKKEDEIMFTKGFKKIKQHSSNDFKESKISKTLGIVFDVSRYNRISESKLFLELDKTICIDHHTNTPDKFDITIIDDNSSSTCELLLSIFNEFGYEIPKTSYEFIYYGLVTDTGRFLHNNVKETTFAAAMQIIKNKVNIHTIYDEIYYKEVNILYLEKYLLNNFIIKG